MVYRMLLRLHALNLTCECPVRLSDGTAEAFCPLRQPSRRLIPVSQHGGDPHFLPPRLSYLRSFAPQAPSAHTSPADGFVNAMILGSSSSSLLSPVRHVETRQHSTPGFDPDGLPGPSASALAVPHLGGVRWKAVNMTGNAAAEARLTGQLQQNGLSSQGTPTITPGRR